MGSDDPEGKRQGGLMSRGARRSSPHAIALLAGAALGVSAAVVTTIREAFWETLHA